MAVPLALLVATLAAGVAANAPPAVAGSKDLGLDLQAEDAGPLVTTEVDASIADPHDVGCGECHLPRGDGAQGGPLRFGEDSIRLCQECHEGANLHPVGIRVPPEMTLGAGDLPLGAGALAGKIVCLTCHYVHRAEGHERHILRTRGKGAGARIQALCDACHAGRLKEKSPHLRAGDTCRYCHINQPREGTGVQSLGVNVQTICNFCHSALDNQHFRALNPFNDEFVAWDPATLELPMLNGRFTCVTCHDPHAESGRKKLLREPYLRMAAVSKKVNPHWKNVMCVACHEREPRPGDAALKEGGDQVRLCYRCHAFKYSRSDIHPVNVRPSRFVTVPEDLPLKGGRVTCSTCHDPSLQEGGERPGSPRRKNPKFLRGGFTSRNEFCFRCHAQGLIGRLNPHEQLDSQGNPEEVKCLFCHASVPRGMAGWMVRLEQFDEVTANNLCLLCHAPSYQESHPFRPHFVRPSKFVRQALESSEERVGIAFPLIGDTVVCITCHDPHQEGVLEEPASATGSHVRKRLRVTQEICRGCHPALR